MSPSLHRPPVPPAVSRLLLVASRKARPPEEEGKIPAAGPNNRS